MHFNFFDMEANWDGVAVEFGGQTLVFTGSYQMQSSLKNAEPSYWFDSYGVEPTSPVGWRACAPAGEQVSLRMYSDGTVTRTGFEFEYEMVSECQSGSIIRNDYDHNVNEDIIISQASDNKYIKMNFEYFYTEENYRGHELKIPPPVLKNAIMQDTM